MNNQHPVGPAFAAGVNHIENSTPFSRFLTTASEILGFGLGRRLGEALRMPGGSDIRYYVANTFAKVHYSANVGTEGANKTYAVSIIETIAIPGSVPGRVLLVLDEAASQLDLQNAIAKAELVAIGFNQAYRDIQALSRADIRQVRLAVDGALEAYRAQFDAARAQAAAAAQAEQLAQVDTVTATA